MRRNGLKLRPSLAHIEGWTADVCAMAASTPDETKLHYARQRPYVKESLEILFFCSDADGAAAEVHGAFRCIKDCDDPTMFGRTLKAGEVQRTHGYLVYRLNREDKIAEVEGPPPEIIQPWRQETS